MSVIDSSAILALLQREPGHDVVTRHLRRGAISTANVQEAVSKLLQTGLPLAAVEADVRKLGLEWVSFDDVHCVSAAELHARHRSIELSYADCACLALAIQRGEPAVTADRIWAQLSDRVSIVLIR